jgi:hypothetical protein
MAGLYANKFRIEISDVTRLVFIDERAPVAEGLPMSTATQAEIVVTHANLRALHELLGKMVDKIP